MMDGAIARHKTFMDNETPRTPPPPPDQPPSGQPPAEVQSEIARELELQAQSATQPLPGPQPAMPGPALVAPIWHTIILVAFILVSSWASSLRSGHQGGPRARIVLYAATIAQDAVLLAFIWYGLRRKKIKLADLIAGKWNRIEDFIIDVALAAGFWVVSIALLNALRWAMGFAAPQGKSSIESVKETVGGLMPQSGRDIAVFILLALMAGFFEEILFRGYLQKQLSALTGNAYAGLIGSGILFGAAHGYQGARMMVLLAAYGWMFGLLAHYRKNLRPGMMAHAWQDSIAGVAFFILTKYKMI